MRTEDQKQKGIVTKDAIKELERDPEEHSCEHVFMEGDGHWYISSWGGEKNPRWTTVPISRAKVKRVVPLQSLLKELTEEEKRSLFRTSFKDQVDEVFHLHNLTWVGVEKWAESCYLLGENPLRHLRKILRGVCEDIRFSCTYPGCFRLQKGEKIVVCCWNEDDYTCTIRVYEYED